MDKKKYGVDISNNWRKERIEDKKDWVQISENYFWRIFEVHPQPKLKKERNSWKIEKEV